MTILFSTGLATVGYKTLVIVLRYLGRIAAFFGRALIEHRGPSLNQVEGTHQAAESLGTRSQRTITCSRDISFL